MQLYICIIWPEKLAEAHVNVIFDEDVDPTEAACTAVRAAMTELQEHHNAITQPTSVQ